MEPMSEYAQLQLRFVDSVQRRYEVIRPIILMGDRTVAERAEETQLHPRNRAGFDPPLSAAGHAGALA